MKNGEEGIKNKIKQRMDSRGASLSITDDIDDEESKLHNKYLIFYSKKNRIRFLKNW